MEPHKDVRLFKEYKMNKEQSPPFCDGSERASLCLAYSKITEDSEE